MNNMKIIMRNVKDLNAAEYNPRQLTAEQFEQIKASMNRFGIVDPIIVNKHKDRMDIIVGGHQRVKVAREIGIEEVPTVEVNLPLAKERELNVRLNKNTGEFDFDLLANNFDVDELVEWGFTSDEIGMFDVDGVDSPELADGDRAPFRQATFTLHDEQWEEVEAALAKAKKAGGGESAVNENSNGNALAWICQRYNRD